MRKLSLAHLTLIGTPPPEMVRIAAAAGFKGISLSMGLSRMMKEAGFRFVEDAGLRRETVRALAETGITLDLVEGAMLARNTDLAAARNAIEILRDMGGRCVNLTWADPDRERAGDNLAAFCDIARDLEMRITLEFTPLSPGVATLQDAVALATCGKYPGLQILVDALHMMRGGATPADLAAVDPDLIGSSQLCDGLLHSPSREAYFDEAFHERLVPGEGEFPLREFVAALPPDMIVLAEAPMRARQAQGMSAEERAQLVFDGSRRVMA